MWLSVVKSLGSQITIYGPILKRVFLFALLLAFVGMLCTPVDSAKKSRAHMILNVPWHQQLNGLSCGAAALEIVFDYWGPDINQKEIMNVARTSSAGTWTFDVERTGHFSYLSDAQGTFFLNVGPSGGFEERALGFSSFSHVSREPWLEELKTLVDNDIPVIVLMKYTPLGGGGHYRVVIGYNDAEQLIYFSDPWGRDTNHLTDWTGIISWSYSDFEMAWNYSESESIAPYFGAATMPWSIDLNIKGAPTEGSIVTVTALIKYQCPEPFSNEQYPAQNAVAQITVPEGITLHSDSSTVSLGTLHAGSAATVTWKLNCSKYSAEKAISIHAWGIVSGSVPEAHWQGQTVYYPSYEYTDAIGGEATILI